MTRYGGMPSKKLVPSLEGNRRCEHRYLEDGSMTLEVECKDCSGAQSLENVKCASGVVNLLASGIIPESIVLKRYIHLRYRSDGIAHLRECASALAVLRRVETQQTRASDRKCRTCPASRQKLAANVARTLQSDPASFGPSRKALSDRLVSEYASCGCTRLRTCVDQVVWAGVAFVEANR